MTSLSKKRPIRAKGHTVRIPQIIYRRSIFSTLALALLLPAAGVLAQEEAQQQEHRDFEVAGLTATILVPVEPVTDSATVFSVDGDRAPWDIYSLRDAFGLVGEPVAATAPDGAEVVIDGDLSVTVMADGSADFTDALYDHAEDAITPVDEAELWDAADLLLDDLEADGFAVYGLKAAEIFDEPCIGEDCDESKEVGRQHAIYAMAIDGLRCFGQGGALTVRFAGDDEPVGFTHALRGLVPESRVQVSKPVDAIKGWMLRIVNDIPWHSLPEDLGTPDTIEVVGADLGYVVPLPGELVNAVKPVYEIRAYVSGTDADGNVYEDVLVQWYQPSDRI